MWKQHHVFSLLRIFLELGRMHCGQWSPALGMPIFMYLCTWCLFSDLSSARFPDRRQVLGPGTSCCDAAGAPRHSQGSRFELSAVVSSAACISLTKTTKRPDVEPWADYTPQSRRPTANGITTRILRQSQVYWKQARMIAKHHDDRLTTLI